MADHQNPGVGTFKPGDSVRWTSHAGRKSTEKVGTVVYAGPRLRQTFLLSLSSPRMVLASSYRENCWLGREVYADFRNAQTRWRFDRPKSLIVRIERTGKKGQPLLPHYYSPNPKWLEKVEAAPPGGEA